MSLAQKLNGFKTPKEEQDHWCEGEAIRRPSLNKQEDDSRLIDISLFSLLAAVSFSPVPHFPPGPASPQ